MFFFVPTGHAARFRSRESHNLLGVAETLDDAARSCALPFHTSDSWARERVRGDSGAEGET
jgi:hypothetical protein